MDDFEFDGEKIVRTLSDPAVTEDVIEALIGCSFYVDNPDKPALIARYEPKREVFVLTTPLGDILRTKARLAQGYIIEPREVSVLQPLIDQATPSHVKRGEIARRRLSDAGFYSRPFNVDDAVRLESILVDKAEGWPPSWEIRQEVTNLLKRYDQDYPLIKIGSSWLECAAQQGQPPLVDMLVQLASASRRTGDLSGALRCTDLANERIVSAHLTDEQASVLLTIRAATYLDFVERDGDVPLLASARTCAAKSYALHPSTQCSSVYRRLESLEKRHQA